MADTTTTITGVVLYDRWPGVAQKPPVDYHDMTAAAVGHDVAYPLWKPGTKWVVENRGDAVSVGVGYWYGGATFIYLKASSEFSDATIVGARGVPCVPLGTLAATMGPEELFIVSGDADQGGNETFGLVAICMSSMTNSHYGWFWCGGTAPIGYVPSLVTADTLPGTAAITAGKEMMIGATAAGGVGFTTATAGTPTVGIALFAFA